MSKPIIFLDFDGVLNTYLTWGKYPKDGAIDPDKVERVTRLVQEFGADVVISSAWRTIYKLDELRAMLNRRGRMPAELVIDKTPDWKGPHSQRGQEIKEWLNKANRREHPFVILDDLYTGAFAGLEAHHIQTTLHDGFTDERYDAAADNLKRQRDQASESGA